MPVSQTKLQLSKRANIVHMPDRTEVVSTGRKVLIWFGIWFYGDTSLPIAWL